MSFLWSLTPLVQVAAFIFAGTTVYSNGVAVGIDDRPQVSINEGGEILKGGRFSLYDLIVRFFTAKGIGNREDNTPKIIRVVSNSAGEQEEFQKILDAYSPENNPYPFISLKDFQDGKVSDVNMSSVWDIRKTILKQTQDFPYTIEVAGVEGFELVIPGQMSKGQRAQAEAEEPKYWPEMSPFEQQKIIDIVNRIFFYKPVWLRSGENAINTSRAYFWSRILNSSLNIDGFFERTIWLSVAKIMYNRSTNIQNWDEQNILKTLCELLVTMNHHAWEVKWNLEWDGLKWLGTNWLKYKERMSNYFVWRDEIHKGANFSILNYKGEKDDYSFDNAVRIEWFVSQLIAMRHNFYLGSPRTRLRSDAGLEEVRTYFIIDRYIPFTIFKKNYPSLVDGATYDTNKEFGRQIQDKERLSKYKPGEILVGYQGVGNLINKTPLDNAFDGLFEALGRLRQNPAATALVYIGSVVILSLAYVSNH